MRKNIFPALRLLAGGCLLLLSGCFKDKITKTYTIVTPVYALKSTVLANINGNAAQPIDSIGRIYIKDAFIYLNEPEKGIHIIDNSDPVHPVQIAFLNIPGNEELAIKGNTLYADMYRELLAIDISDPHHIKVTGMAANVFTDRYDGQIGYTTVTPNGTLLDSNLLITGYIKKDTIINTDAPKGAFPFTTLPYFYTAAANSSASAGSSGGLAGSMAKMVLLKDYLYTIPDPHSIGIVNVTNTPSPALVSTVGAGLDLETIYPFNDKLFLGSMEGVYIFDVSNPVAPVAMSTFTHGRACDPVVADGSYAYVTLHSGTSCGGSSNELDVLNVQNLQQPTQIGTYPMTGPQGLCKDNNLLFVCDGAAGIKVYDATDPASLKLLSQVSIRDATDVIAANQRLLIVAGGNLYQYDYSNAQDIRLVSSLSVK